MLLPHFLDDVSRRVQSTDPGCWTYVVLYPAKPHVCPQGVFKPKVITNSPCSSAQISLSQWGLTTVHSHALPPLLFLVSPPSSASIGLCGGVLYYTCCSFPPPHHLQNLHKDRDQFVTAQMSTAVSGSQDAFKHLLNEWIRIGNPSSGCSGASMSW